jgi:hypothetical protein
MVTPNIAACTVSFSKSDICEITWLGDEIRAVFIS